MMKEFMPERMKVVLRAAQLFHGEVQALLMNRAWLHFLSLIFCLEESPQLITSNPNDVKQTHMLHELGSQAFVAKTAF